MPQTIADGLQSIINAKSDIDGAIEVKGGIVTKGLVNSDDDIMTIKNAVTSIDITENGTYYIGEETVVTSSTFPVEVNDSNGTPLRHVDINGNTVQDGTPTQSNPVEVNGVGERTGNWYNIATAVGGRIDNGALNGSEYVTISSRTNTSIIFTTNLQARGIVSDYIAVPNGTENAYLSYNTNGITGNKIACFDSNKTFISDVGGSTFTNVTFSLPQNTAYLRVVITAQTADVEYTLSNLMLSYSNLSFIPYGYKIPISNGGVTTNIYLGSVQSYREIKKIEYTGAADELWIIANEGTANAYALDSGNPAANQGVDKLICTHYQASEIYNGNTNTGILVVSNGDVRIRDTNAESMSISSFKAYLAQQYANGTPVTVWYVLTTPETAAVNEPLMKIGDYADSLSVDVELPLSQNTKNIIDVNTTLKPSSASFTYDKISEYIGYNEINVDVSNTYTAEDEGKVVSEGNLIAQTAMPDEITENDTIDTTFYNSVTVNVPTGVDPEPINDVLEEANDELEAALGGGGSTPVAKGQVNFYDYDGTLVKSMSSAQFRGLESMPENPSHEGLTAQGWNWSLSDAKTYVATYGSLDIGQMYVTSDGKTRIYINLPEGKTSPVLMLYLNANTELDIDWGDSSTHSTWTTTSAAYKSGRHNYPDKGEYVIAITVVSGSFILQSQSTSYNTFFTNGKNNNTSSDRVYLNSIQKIEIGTGISQIGNYVFYYCTSLSSITIPNNVTTIENYAFQYCYVLSSITIPNNVTTIGNSAFNKCYSLSSITIPNNVTTIGTNVFNGCYSLSSITISSSVTSIGSNAFDYCYSLSSVTIPSSVTTIGTYAFHSCYALYSITIPNNVTSIGSNAFNNCYSLSSITIPNNVTTIGDYAFNSCYALSSITISSSVTSIGSNAFQNCYSLSSITIPNNVTTIGSNAFNNCNSMDYIRFIPSTPPTVQASNAWTYVSTTTIIYIPALVSNLYMKGTNYPSKSSYKYVGYATYTSGETLPSTTTDETYTLTWYATSADAIAQTNPITQGTGTEVYSRATPVA